MLTLVVDDNETARTFFTKVLTNGGYQVLAFDNAVPALNCLAQTEPDVALLDYHLGGPDGLTLAHFIRTRYPTCPIIMISNFVEEPQFVEMLRINVDDFIRKASPTVTPEYILERVGAAIVQKRTRTPQVSSPNSPDPTRPNTLHLDGVKHVAQWRNKEIHLTPLEYKILEQLYLTGRVINYSDLLTLCTGERLVPEPARLRLKTHLHHLKTKFKMDGQCPVRTVWGQGFAWSPNETHDAIS